MKTTEAPEKIYVEITHPISDKYTEIIAFEHGNGIEYIRTDAFIEKACEWLKTNAGNYAFVDTDRIGNVADIDLSLVQDFRKYMKGE